MHVPRNELEGARGLTIKAMSQPGPEYFATEQWVPYPVELVFAFFANPQNLPHLMPPRMKVRVEDLRIVPAPPRPLAADLSRRFQSLAAGVGTEILISFYPIPWVPRRVSWMARIVEFEWNSHFLDEQSRGPFIHFQHRHGIELQSRDGVEGTLVSDRIEFALPYGRLGQIGAKLISGQLASQFAHRQTRLPQILEAAQRQAARRA